ncbi:hypothetical protein pb186bvf_015356 [Paramecium bursaria]
MHKSATEYLGQIDYQIQFLHQYYNTQLLPKDALTIAKFQRVYKYIDESYRNGFMSEDELFNVYGYFLSTIKKFKRNAENRLYYNTSDYQATIEKLGRMNIRLVPIYHELVLVERNPSIKMEDFLDVDFPHHIYTKQELVQFSLQIFDFLNFQQFKIPQNILEQLLQEMAYNYNVIPYHNFTHAFQLVQLLFSCFKKSKLKEFVNDLEIVFAILAGLAHDLNHKGVNNAYKIKKSKKYNILTSETAVLENMHCATFFNIITLNRNLDIFSYLTNEDQKVQAKRLIITCILATDMGKHFKLLGKFQKRVESTVKFQPSEVQDELAEFQRLSSEKNDDRQFILNIMVHACDISNPCMGFQNYMNWSYLLSQEFMDQTIKEANIGVDVTGFLVYKDKPTFYGGQIGFSSILYQQPRKSGVPTLVNNWNSIF